MLQDLEAGRLNVPADADIWQDINAVVRNDDGSLDLSSCSPRLRSYARACFAAMTGIESIEAKAPRASAIPSAEETAGLNRELFARLEEVFQRLCGVSTEQMIMAAPHFRTAYEKKKAAIVKRATSRDNYVQYVEDTLNDLRAYLGSTNMDRWRGAVVVSPENQDTRAHENRVVRAHELRIKQRARREPRGVPRDARWASAS